MLNECTNMISTLSSTYKTVYSLSDDFEKKNKKKQKKNVPTDPT